MIIISSIPKSKRTESKLEPIHLSYKIRKELMQELMMSFAFSEKRYKSYVNSSVDYIKDEIEKEGRKNILYKMQDSYIPWLVNQERNDTLKYLKGISNYLVAANSLMDKAQYYFEFEEIIKQLNHSIECCWCLQQELQYIAERIPADKNKYMNFVLDIKKEINLIQGLIKKYKKKYKISLKNKKIKK